jgi:retinol dehydrogenase 14
MKGKIVVITGGTGGIGYQSARELLRRGATVLVTGRDRARGDAATERLRADSGSDDVRAVYADMLSLAAAQELARSLLQELPRIDVLLNNAGWASAERTVSPEGLEASMAVNHLCPFALTVGLLPSLRAAGEARVINVCGGGPSSATLPFDDLEYERGYVGLNAYNTSKLVNMAVSLELGRRLEGSGVTVNVVYPGAAPTDLWGRFGPDMMPSPRWLWWPVFKAGATFLMRGDKDPSRSVVWAASAPELAGVTGRYLSARCRESTVPRRARDADAVTRLWSFTLERAGIEEVALDAGARANAA